ncbi:MAG: PQQ-binding-like beta-propeller repeat protein [Pseudomonadota bacterium]
MRGGISRAGMMRAGMVRAGVLGLLTAGLLGGCSLFDDEEKLEGERIRIRAEAPEAPGSFGPDSAGANGAVPLPAPQPISEWTQTNAVSNHNAGHLAGPGTLDRVWASDAGSGNSDDGTITGAPVVSGGSVFVLDAEAQVSAFDTSDGDRRWQSDLTPENEDGSEGFGGGLAVDRGRLFVTTGFGEVVALDTASGEVIWRTGVGAPFRAAPATRDGVVVAVTRDNRAFGFDAASGEILWRVPGATSGAGLLGGASPAIEGRVALVPFASGELVAVESRNGRRFWNAVLGGGRRGLARSSIADVTGDPVVVGPLVVAANQSGRIVAIEGRSGRRIWTRSLGAVRPIWAAGDTIFLVSDAGALMRLSARNGSTIWSTQLPVFEDPEDREDPIGYSGPVLVEGRVLVTSSVGELLAFEGVGGQAVSTTDLAGGSTTGPVVADGTVFVLSDGGVLEAFR